MAETYKEPDKIMQYMAALEANLAKATGKSLAQWVKIAKTCPHAKPRERLKWLKDKHGLGQSRAGLVLARAFGGSTLGDNDAGDLVDKLFSKSFADQRALYEKVATFASRLADVRISPRRSFVALYRLKQFGRIRPSKAGLQVGLALKKYPKSARFVDVKSAAADDRVKKALLLGSLKDFDTEAKELLKQAYDEN
jgi:Domain of unknown function (DUF5655)/Domain of unknown function (DUF4287)